MKSDSLMVKKGIGDSTIDTTIDHSMASIHIFNFFPKGSPGEVWIDGEFCMKASQKHIVVSVPANRTISITNKNNYYPTTFYCESGKTYYFQMLSASAGTNIIIIDLITYHYDFIILTDDYARFYSEAASLKEQTFFR